jgi:GTP-binding protein LepA
VPPPKQEVDKPLKALIFDSFFDTYKGVVAQVRIMEGQTPKLQTPIHFLGTKASGQALEVGYFAPALAACDKLQAGDIGYIATGIKEPDKVRVGDTITSAWSLVSGNWQQDVDISQIEQLPGYKEVKPMVYVGLYPIDADEYFELKEALGKFKLNDPAFSYEQEQSNALGSGFRCGFLGLLHAEVVQERLQMEFGVDLLATAPSVEYLVGDESVSNPAEIDFSKLREIKEPWVSLKIFVPGDFLGSIMDLVQERRGRFVNQTYYGAQVELAYEMPLADMITDFYDKLKSVSSGYASLDWEFLDFRAVDAVRVDILVGGEKVDALSQIVYRPKAEGIGRRLVGKLKEVLPRQNFAIALQATIGGNVIARETISPYRKDVTAKLYGGDVTRKNKLLDKQKKGKKKMKMIGRVEIPQEAFLSILKS